MATHSSTLAWQIPWTEEPGGLQSMGSLTVGHDWATSVSPFTFMHWRRKWQPTPVFLPGESQGRGNLVGCRLWGHTESDTTEVTQQQQQHRMTGHKDKERYRPHTIVFASSSFFFFFTFLNVKIILSSGPCKNRPQNHGRLPIPFYLSVMFFINSSEHDLHLNQHGLLFSSPLQVSSSASTPACSSITILLFHILILSL